MRLTEGNFNQTNTNWINDRMGERFSASYEQTSNRFYIPFGKVENEFDWAEKVYEIGDIIISVAYYNNVPQLLQKSLRRLVAAEYKKKLFSIPLFQASLLLSASGVLRNFQHLEKDLNRIQTNVSFQLERQKAINYISQRKENDLIIMAFKSGELIASMTLYPFSTAQDTPSLSYLKLDPYTDSLPNVPGIGIGRLAKASIDKGFDRNPTADLTNTAGVAALFVAANNFVRTQRWLKNPSAFICGDTYGSFFACLNRFFPTRTIKSVMNPKILDDENPIRDMALYFVQRQILGGFESSDDLISAIRRISQSDAKLANRIEKLLEFGLRKKDIGAIKDFEPKKFRLNFFHFPFNHPKTINGFKRLEKIVLRATQQRTHREFMNLHSENLKLGTA